MQRLTAPRVRIAGSGLFADRRVDGRLSAASPSIRVEARGIVDLAGGRYRDVALAAELIRPPGLVPQHDRPAGAARGLARRPVRHGALRLSADRAADRLRSDRVRGGPRRGPGNLSRAPVVVPVLVTARRVTGVGEVAGGILANLRVQGQLRVTARRLWGDDLASPPTNCAARSTWRWTCAPASMRSRSMPGCAPIRSRASAWSTCCPSCARCRGRAGAARW